MGALSARSPKITKTITKVHIDGPLGVAGRNSDNKLIKEKIGWAPNYPLSTGIQKTYKWISGQIKEKNQTND